MSKGFLIANERLKSFKKKFEPKIFKKESDTAIDEGLKRLEDLKKT